MDFNTLVLHHSDKIMYLAGEGLEFDSIIWAASRQNLSSGFLTN